MDSGLLSDDSFDMAIDDDPPISFLRTSASEFPLGHEIDWTSHHNLSSDIVVQLDKYTIPEPVSARSPEYLAIETNLSPQNDVTSPLVAPKETVSPEETLSPLSPSPGAITPSSSTYYPSPLSDVQMTLPDFQEEEETELEATGKISVLAAPSAALVPEPSDASYRLTGTSEPVEESIAERVLASPNKRRRVNAPVARPRSSSILSLPPSDANKRRRLESPAARSRSSSVLSSPPSEDVKVVSKYAFKSKFPTAALLHSALTGARRLRPFGVSLPPILLDNEAYEYALPDFLSAVASYQNQGGVASRRRIAEAWGVPLPDQLKSRRYAPREFALPEDVVGRKQTPIPSAPVRPTPSPVVTPTPKPVAPQSKPKPRMHPSVVPLWRALGPVLRLGPPADAAVASSSTSTSMPPPAAAPAAAATNMSVFSRRWIPYVPPTYPSFPAPTRINPSAPPTYASPPPAPAPTPTPTRPNPHFTAFAFGVALPPHLLRADDDDPDAPDFSLPESVVHPRPRSHHKA